MDKKKHLRNVAIGTFVIVLSLWNYSQLSGKESIRLIHEVTLLTCGAGIGVFISNLFMLFKKQK